MMKSRKVRAVSCTVAAALALGTASVLLSACAGERVDNESTPLSLASDLFDGVFNPYFYTSGPDGEVVGQTQIGLLSSNESGTLVAGEEEPSVALDYSVVTRGTSADKGTEGTADEYARYYTDYYFAIKDDITFSDGTPLTINDVLFNIYMYLDPSYTGSSTMYSVDIQGLAAYRTQSLTASDQEGFEETFNGIAEDRINAIRDWAQSDSTSASVINGGDAQMTSDVDKVHELFLEELNSDWTTAMNVEMTEYEKYNFRGNYEVFLYNYGQITVRPIRDSATGNVTYEVTRNYDQNMATDQETLVNYIFNVMLGGRQTATDDYRNNLVDIIYYYATAQNFRAYLVSEAILDEFDKDGDGVADLNITSVSGITTERSTRIPVSYNSAGDVTEWKELGKELDILKIRINGEDPKAIQNFSVTVAPLHYYSPIADQFNYGPDVDPADYNFGVSWSNADFMNEVRAIQVPLGAGPYRATRDGGSSPSEVTDQTLTKSEFYSDNIVYFERNDNFLLGAPKIRFLRYQVVSQSLLYDAIETGTVHYGSPTASSDTMGRLEGEDAETLDYRITDNLGYGYIGINASFVPDIDIRKAIMTTFNTAPVLDYYGGGTLASILYRPMSTVLVAYQEADEKGNMHDVTYYPSDAKEYYPYDPSGSTALAFARRAGYTETNDDALLVNSEGETLHYTFTVAGDSVDHPAYNTLVQSARILNSVGFDITVTTDSTALSKLASGQLEVWAAAWSSSSDPDMYQVYHMDSTATSILNWGFPSIERQTDDYDADLEKDLLEALAAKIEEGRETTDTHLRRNAYSVSTTDKLYTITDSDPGSTQLHDVTITENNISANMEGLCALDLVMELAVEFPLYQRSALYVFANGLFDEATLALFDESTAFQSPLSKIWLVSYAQEEA